MENKTETIASGVCHKLSGLLHGSDWAGGIYDALRHVYSEFGEVQHISGFQVDGKKGFFLVSFAEDRSAIKAANATGCGMFGFTTVLVDLGRLAPSSAQEN
ncbi:MAG: hypothetical protein BWY57_01509 [Betaproteobacteria bacterium ADurb.Bin341]|nr:MAG: hypothetical protein BWY57_01509 [Betaproteobacteria bacterium ADurb.Bin341]